MAALLNYWRHIPTHRSVWELAAPMALSNISVPLVALVDSMVIGHLPHAHQMGAVAVGASIYTLLTCAIGCLRMGSTSFAAQAAGRSDGVALRQILLQGILMALGLAILLGTVGIPVSHLALEWMQPSPELNQLTKEFLHTRFFGLPAALSSYALVGWFLGTQNARAPLAILVTTNIVNISLNLWFVLSLGWGVAGSAWASVVAEWTGSLLGLVLMQKALCAYPGRISWIALKRWESWRLLLAVNRDIFIRNLTLQSVFFMITVQGARLGDATVAANALLLNGLLLTSHTLDGLAHAIEALCGHAIGAHDRQTLHRSFVVACGWSLIASVGFALLFTFYGHLFIAMQTNIPSVRETAKIYIPYLASLPFITVWSYLIDGLFIAATRAREMRNGILLTLVITLPFACALQVLGNHGLWISFLLFMALRSLTLWAIAQRLSRKDQWIR